MPRRILIAEDDPTFQRKVHVLLDAKGYASTVVEDGASALDRIRNETFDLVLLDIGLPKKSGLEVLNALSQAKEKPKVIVITGDTTSDTVLESVRAQAYQYVAKPVDAQRLADLIEDALETPLLPIEVVSAKPDWVELLVPCQANVPDRVQSFLQQLERELDEETRESIGQAFRELMMNAVEWGGQLDPARKVRIVAIRTDRLLIYRIADPGAGFNPEELGHAAIGNPEEEPFRHVAEREGKQIRPGGFGLLMARSLVDELVYNEAHNEVVFVKYLDGNSKSK